MDSERIKKEAEDIVEIMANIKQANETICKASHAKELWQDKLTKIMGSWEVKRPND